MCPNWNFTLFELISSILGHPHLPIVSLRSENGNPILLVAQVKNRSHPWLFSYTLHPTLNPTTPSHFYHYHAQLNHHHLSPALWQYLPILILGLNTPRPPVYLLHAAGTIFLKDDLYQVVPLYKASDGREEKKSLWWLLISFMTHWSLVIVLILMFLEYARPGFLLQIPN